jgi:hypothetical protein
MKKFYITFGFSHTDTKGHSLKNCYTVIEAQNEEKAREKMFSHALKNQWAFLYPSAQDAGVLRYKLNLVPFNLL